MNNTVLIVDDEKELALILIDYLKKDNINAVAAFDGEEALSMLKDVDGSITGSNGVIKEI